MSQELTQQYLKECLDYNPDTGVFVWKKRPLSHFINDSIMKSINTRQSGKAAASKHNCGYICVCLGENRVLAHRLAWLYIYGYMPEKQIDHINGVRTDNRICNLREATNGENCQNLKTARSNNKTTGLLGAHFSKTTGNYCAQITINGKKITIGYFETSQEAHESYLKNKRELHPFGEI